MKLARFAMAVLSALLLAGCETAVLQHDAASPAEDESILVLGVQPANYRVMLFPGTVNRGEFSQDFWSGAAISGAPKNGYIVAKVKAGQVLGLSMIVQSSTDGGHFGSSFVACGGRHALTFEVPKSKVVYVTDVEYTSLGASLSVRYTNRFAAAESHLRAHYPNIQGPLQQLEFRSLPASNPCQRNTIVIPVNTGR